MWISLVDDMFINLIELAISFQGLDCVFLCPNEEKNPTISMDSTPSIVCCRSFFALSLFNDFVECNQASRIGALNTTCTWQYTIEPEPIDSKAIE